MRYYDLQKNWTKKIEPHLANKQLNDILVRDLNKRSSSQWGKPFVHGQYPSEYGEFEWMIERKGRPPRYWRYTQTGACHWLVNFNLKLATLVEPQQRWRIVTSAKHSTVWDGAERRTSPPKLKMLEACSRCWWWASCSHCCERHVRAWDVEADPVGVAADLLMGSRPRLCRPPHVVSREFFRLSRLICITGG